MLSALLSVGWEPEIRGWIIVIISVVVLMGSTYLLLGTNVGARHRFPYRSCRPFGLDDVNGDHLGNLWNWSEGA